MLKLITQSKPTMLKIVRKKIIMIQTKKIPMTC